MKYDIYKIPYSTKRVTTHSYTDRRPTKLGELVKRLFGRKTLHTLCKIENLIKPYGK